MTVIVLCNISVLCDNADPRYAVTWGNHTVPSKQASSWLFMYGCEWLLCCSLLPSSLVFFHLLIHVLGLNRRAQSLSRWTDQEGTAGWHRLALSLLPRYRAGVEQSPSQIPWRGCSVENRRWSPTAKRQLPGECWCGGSWSSALKGTYYACLYFACILRLI